MQDLIEEFMAQKRFAIVGATADTKKYGNEIFRNLTSRGYEVYPVNPRLEELEGTCKKSLENNATVDFQNKEETICECVSDLVSKNYTYDTFQNGVAYGNNEIINSYLSFMEICSEQEGISVTFPRL